MKAGIVNSNENSSKKSNGDLDHDDSDDEKDEEYGVGGAAHQGGRLAQLMRLDWKEIRKLRDYSCEEKEKEEAKEEERCGS